MTLPPGLIGRGRQIRDALGRLFEPEADLSLVRLIRSKAPALSLPEVRASLARLRTTFDFPVVASPGGDRMKRLKESGPRPELRPAAPGPTTRTRDGTPWRNVTLAQLIEAGSVRLPFDIEHRFRGAQLRARIEAADRIILDGQSYDSLSTAGGLARRSVSDASPGRDYPSTNGWSFWHYSRADGTLATLDDLRRELHQRKVVRFVDASRAGA